VVFVAFAGSLWALAAFVTPTLFYAQPDRHLAGLLAARMFTVETGLALAAAALALLTPVRGKYLLGYVATALLTVNEWVLRPVMASALAHGKALGLGFGPWHGVSGLLYVGACLLVLALTWRESFR
jgi:Domain of unknown function (DUF4149)